MSLEKEKREEERKRVAWALWDVNHVIMVEDPQNPLPNNPKIRYAHSKPKPPFWEDLTEVLISGPTTIEGAATKFRRSISLAYPFNPEFYHPKHNTFGSRFHPSIEDWNFLKVNPNPRMPDYLRDLLINSLILQARGADLSETFADYSALLRVEGADMPIGRPDYPDSGLFIKRFIPSPDEVKTLVTAHFELGARVTLNTGILYEVRRAFMLSVINLLRDVVQPELAAVMNTDPEITSSSFTKPIGVGVIANCSLEDFLDDGAYDINIFFRDNDFLNCRLIAEYYGITTFCSEPEKDALSQPHLEYLGCPDERDGKVEFDPTGEKILDKIADTSFYNVPKPGTRVDL